MTIRVLAVDDEPMIRQGLTAILSSEADIDVVAEAGDGAEAVSAVRQHSADLVLMDVRMPHVDGIEATATITSRWPGTVKVLVLTTFSDDDYVIQAMTAGASGFLLKRASGEQLAQAVRTVHAGDSLLLPRQVCEMFASRRPAPEAHPGFARLTPREEEVLRLMADGATNADIAARLHLAVETVKSHVASILAKLDARDRTQAVVRAYRDRLVVV